MTTVSADVNNQVKEIKERTGLKAVEVLRELMWFNHTKAKDIITEILVHLKKDDVRGDLIALMYKEYGRVQDILIDCANKLAPFEDAKLQAMEVKTKSEHVFVIQAPKISKDVSSWLQEVGGKRLELEKMPDKQTIIKNYPSEITDIEEVNPDYDLPPDQEEDLKHDDRF